MWLPRVRMSAYASKGKQVHTSWTPLQREVYANHLASVHRPAESPLGLRWLGGVVPIPYIRKVRCAHCGALWMCDRAAWAERWESGLHADAEHAYADDTDDALAHRYLETTLANR